VGPATKPDLTTLGLATKPNLNVIEKTKLTKPTNWLKPKAAKSTTKLKIDQGKIMK
jgi:hypothetical protein